MVYEKIYKALIDKRRKEKPIGYTETHHIIPASFGGSNKKSNLIELSAGEHFIAHYLLLKMQVKNTPQYHSMRKAFLMMGVVSPDNSERYISSLTFAKLREEEATYKSIMYVGSGNSQYGTMWVCNPLTKHNKKIKIDEEIPIGYYKGRGLVEKVCPNCGKKFHTSKGIIYCCVECYHNNKFSKNVELVCVVCGTKFLSNRNLKTCSKKCKNIEQSKHNKTNKYSAKITKEDVLRIRSEEFSSLTLKEISKLFNITEANVSCIKKYKTWKDVS